MLALQAMLNTLDYKRKVSDNVLSFVVSLLSLLIPTPNTQMRKILISEEQMNFTGAKNLQNGRVRVILTRS